MSVYDWHTEDDDKLGRALVAACEQACKDNAPRAADAAVFARLVDGQLCGFIGHSGDSSPYYGLVASTPIYRNTARSVYETECAKVVGLSEDLPQLMSTGGDYRHQQMAIKQTRWLDALYSQRHGSFSNLQALFRQGFALAQVTGSAAMFPELYPDGRIEGHLDSTLTMGIQRSGRFGRAISVVRTRPRAREEAIEIYGDEFENAIREAPCHKDSGSLAYGEAQKRDEVAIYEGWRMSSGGESGFWIHCLHDGTVLDEGDYDSSDLPCSLFHCYEPIGGEWGVPLVRHIIEACLAENNSLTDFIHAVEVASSLIGITDSEEIHKKLSAMPKVAAFKKKRTEALDFIAPQVSEQQSRLADMLRSAAFETSGVNESAANSKRLGGNSGIHEHYIATLTSERKSVQSRAVTQWRAIDSARVLIRAGTMAKERYPEATVFYKSEDESEELKLSDLDLEGADRFVLTFAATDEQRNSPKARLQMAKDMLDAGRITPAEYFEQERHLDTMALQDRLSIHTKWLDKQIQRWLSIPDNELANPFDDLVQEPTPFVGKDVLRHLIDRASDAHTEARVRGASAARLQLFENFLETAAEELKTLLREEAAMSAPPAPAGPPPGAAAQAVGAMSTPTVV